MRKRHSWRKILITAVLCPAMALSMAACSQKAPGAGATEGSTAKESTGEESGKKSEEVVFHPPVDTPFVTPGEKEETVYVKADAAGNPTEKSVEVVLKEIEGSDPIEDRSNLRDIKNTEGNEEVAQAGEGRYLWENHGEDIHYKGISDEKLPVDVHVTYFLEGQEVSAEQIAGKTGKVKIRFDYDNNTDVPFMVLSSVILSSDVFSDLEVTNGKVMDLGDQKAVIGFAFPGLMDSLKLADYEPTEEIELPEYVEIEARAEDFELDFTATVVSTGLFDEIEDKDLEDLEEMSDNMNELTDASTEIKDGARELADAGGEYGGYLSQYFDGLAQLSEGTDQLEQGLMALSQNIAKISEGSKGLQEGLSQVDSSLSALDLSSIASEESDKEAAAAQEALTSLAGNSALLSEKLGDIETNLETVRTFKEDVETYCGQVKDLKKAIEEHPAPDLSEKAEDWGAALNTAASEQAQEKAADAAQKAASEAVDTAAENAAQATAQDARDAVEKSVGESGALDELELTDEQKDAVKEQLISEIQAAIEANTGEKPEVTVEAEDVEIALDEAFAAIIEEIQTDGDERYKAISEAAAAVTEPEIPDLTALGSDRMEEIGGILDEMNASLAVVGSYSEGMASKAAALGQLSASLQALQAGVSQLSDGSDELTKGIGLFEEAITAAAEGSSQLSSAVSMISSAGCELGSAYWLLVEGMEEFADGLAEFDEEGIQSLAELAGPEYLDVIKGVRAARDAEHGYTNFSGICEGQKGSVKFIIETAEISAD